MPEPRSSISPRRARVALGALVIAAALAPRPAEGASAGAQCTTANQQSTKLRTAKKLRQARDQALLCAAATCAATVRTACKKRAADLQKAIPTIIFQAKDPSGDVVTDVKVSMDGESLATRLDGLSLAVDPGQHTFTFEAEGRPPVDQPFLIKEGQQDRHETITLPAKPPPPAPEVAAAPASVESTSAPDSGSGSSKSPLRVVAYTVGGVGIASLIVGGVTGGLALSKWHSSESECASPTNCTNHAQAVSDHDSAASLGTVSTITFIAGGIAVATGVTLFFLSPKKNKEGDAPGASPASSASPSAFVRMDPLVGPGVGGLSLKGAF